MRTPRLRRLPSASAVRGKALRTGLRDPLEDSCNGATDTPHHYGRTCTPARNQSRGRPPAFSTPTRSRASGRRRYVLASEDVVERWSTSSKLMSLVKTRILTIETGPPGDNYRTPKTCSRCGRRKPLYAFYKQVGGAQGRRSRCKACYKELRRSGRVPGVHARPSRRGRPWHLGVARRRKNATGFAGRSDRRQRASVLDALARWGAYGSQGGCQRYSVISTERMSASSNVRVLGSPRVCGS
jgi:hypothetical protein